MGNKKIKTEHPTSKASETLGAHLRNLLSPYQTLLCLVDDVINGNVDFEMLKKYRCNNIDSIIAFSHSDEMENNIWRNGDE